MINLHIRLRNYFVMPINNFFMFIILIVLSPGEFWFDITMHIDPVSQ